MKTTYKNRYGDIFTFELQEDGNILWTGNFEWCRFGMPNDYTNAYNAYLKDNEHSQSLMTLAQFKDVVHNYDDETLSYDYPKYVKMVESLIDEISMVDPSGGPYLSRGMSMDSFGFEGYKIEDFKKINKTKGLDFSEKFRRLVDQYNERKEDSVLVSDVLEDFSDEIIDLLQALKKEKESFADLGINLEEKAFYDILLKLAIKYDFTYPEDKLLDLSKAVKDLVDDKARYTDWSQREDIKAELKVGLILLLAQHGYPPVDKDEVYKEIFEQAENFKRFRAG